MSFTKEKKEKIKRYLPEDHLCSDRYLFCIIMEIKTEYHGDLLEHEKYADLRSVYR